MFLMILWMLAGFFIGWVAMDIIPLTKQVRSTWWQKIGSGLLGVLIVYTIFEKCI